MFEAFLKQHDTATWARTREALLASMHEVDRDATRIWFHFFPLALSDALAQSDDPDQLARTLRLDGSYRLADQCDSSHWFLYGHRYWPEAKEAIIRRADSAASPASLDLAAIVRDLAREAAAAAGVSQALLVGIVAVGLSTLQQVGLSALRRSSGAVSIPAGLAKQSPDRIAAARETDDRQGIFGFLRGVRSQYSVRFDERQPDARFTVINLQHLTTAAANDTRDYSSGTRLRRDGPIPVRCRSASCGTCWVGILGGATKLSTVEPLEARAMKEFGYINSTDPTPVIRLACQAVASGNATIVIPPWNGVIGKAGLGGA
ncbi:MAG: 2Fe-2S iron-sulfur cluster-binding protein [Acidobacteriota bacterium]